MSVGNVTKSMTFENNKLRVSKSYLVSTLILISIDLVTSGAVKKAIDGIFKQAANEASAANHDVLYWVPTAP
jgi:hypothetical protein